MSTKTLWTKELAGLCLLSPLLLILPGCLATRGWVSEQIKPVGTRMTNIEEKMALTNPQLATNLVSQQVKPLKTRVISVEQRVSGMEDRLASAESGISQVSSKADKTLKDFKDLRLDRRLVLDFKQGAYFLPNSARLLELAKMNIDKFLSTLKRQPADNHLFFVAGYTDSMGSSDLNYELGRKRADSVGRYLIMKKAIHPTRVITVSGGDRNPAAKNTTFLGREKNRRVEILVYKDVITRVQAEIAATLSRMSLTPEVAPGN